MCPECGARLICPSCKQRIKIGRSSCENCLDNTERSDQLEAIVRDPHTGIEFLFVPGGHFMMGDLFDEGLETEKPLHRVHLDRYYISKYPVTQKQWMRLMPENTSRFQGDNQPVEQISWDDVQIFIERISDTISAEYSVDLPSEAQWEYAARSGGRNEKYAGSSDADHVAWYDDNSHGNTHPVGMKAPNGLGIHDMSGNVWEWCQDSFQTDAYQYHDQENPVMISNERDRVIRGGSWNVDSWSVRCARRNRLPQDLYGPGLGFRLVLNPKMN
jgi:formylglycine-generating enzyme required for sulfatase activity